MRLLKFFLCCAWFAACGWIIGWASPVHADQSTLLTQLRRPAALALADSWLYVANRASGTISVVDTASRSVVQERVIGMGLSSLGAIRDGRYLLATDEIGHELIVVRAAGADLHPVQRMGVSHSPVDVAIAPDESICSVASLWSQRVTLIEIASGVNRRAEPKLSVRKVIDLPFAPRLQWFDPRGRWLVVADSRRGRLGIIDLQTSSLRAIRSLDGHNIRGLASHGRELLIAHQRLSGITFTTRDRVFWGTLMGNRILAVDVDELVAPATAASAAPVEKMIAHWSLYPVGEPRNGAGDPGALLVTDRGVVVACLSGVSQVGFMTLSPEPDRRLDVGRRPTALAIDAAQEMIYVANSLDDSVSVIDAVTQQVVDTISLGPQPPLMLAQRGEQLFYDSRLSLDGWLSCNSCHTDGHTNGQLNDNLGDDGFGAPKRVLSLLGVADTGPWAWNARQPLLTGQIHKSIQFTMQGEDTGHLTGDNVDALVAFVRNLDPPPSLAHARGTLPRDAAAIARGLDVFSWQGCGNCHLAPKYTTTSVYDVGLRDENGQSEFNPPSLRGVSQRGPYLHDGRAETLRDVFEKHQHPDDLELDSAEIDDLLVFLNTL